MESQPEKFSLIPEKPKFYQTFLDVLEEEFSLDEQINSNFKDSGFRNSLIGKKIDARTIMEMAPYMARLVKKPQRISVDLDNLYVGLDCLTNTHYICFEVPMIDFDRYKLENGEEAKIQDVLPHCRCQIQQVIKNWKSPEECDVEEKRSTTWQEYKCLHPPSPSPPSPSPPSSPDTRSCVYRYAIYESIGGFHAFVISHEFKNRDPEVIQLMIEAQTDYFYVVFTYLRGWCVRLNRKSKDPKGIPIYKYSGDVVNGKWIQPNNPIVPIIPKYRNLLNFHMDLCKMVAEDDDNFGTVIGK